MAALLLAGAALLSPAVAACGTRRRPPSSFAPSRTVRQVRTPRRHAASMPAVQVTVVDGDTNRRVRGARVTIGRRSARTTAHGVARIPLLRRAALVTQAVQARLRAKRACASRSARTRSRRSASTAASLQWTMYGADPQRHAGAAGDPRAAAVPRRLVARPRRAASSSRPSSRTAWRTSRTRRARSARSTCATAR